MAIGPNVVDDCEGMTEEDYWRGMDEAMQDEEPAVPPAPTFADGMTAAHGVTLESGDVVLSARLIERIFLAMDAAR